VQKSGFMLRGCLCHESLRATERAALPARACSARCPPPLAAAGSIVWDTKQRQIFNTRRTMHADQAGRAARFQERDPDARILAQREAMRQQALPHPSTTQSASNVAAPLISRFFAVRPRKRAGANLRACKTSFTLPLGGIRG